ncbi:CoA ester lyase [Helicobacter sp. 11S02629-2]|uniref:HpcH/HpaI aldolase/citrate lyase family protein n=1 Tax=Helicobacter sp. 11S02629-2 TaxID=1476195 RepID=UPI000BA59527|nr:CoA ester lyase [Helicobacter sp. 11S02629-2]PAF45999.1 hypothetical protein BKH40_00895 [Helicobacter sp. 11S02629-2]
MMELDSLKSLLFVPGSKPERFLKAFSFKASGVILDLEDAVDEDSKELARNHIKAFARDNKALQFFVRINSIKSRFYQDDLKLLDSIKPSLLGVMLSKAQSKKEIEALDFKVIALIETALGISNLKKLARAKNLLALSFGSLDLALDLGLEKGRGKDLMLEFCQAKLVVQSRVNNLPSPLNGVYANFKDLEGLASECEVAKSMGFGGALCIHPSQVEVINKAFNPSPKVLAWAREILELAKLHNNAVFNYKGEMIDLPVILRAKSIVTKAL